MNLLIIHEIILHEVFCVCLLSLSIVFSSFLRLVADNIPLSWENVEQRKDRIGFALCPSGCHVESGLGGCYEWNSVPQRDILKSSPVNVTSFRKRVLADGQVQMRSWGVGLNPT